MAFSPDRTTLAVVDGNGGLTLIFVDSRSTRKWDARSVRRDHPQRWSVGWKNHNDITLASPRDVVDLRIYEGEAVTLDSPRQLGPHEMVLHMGTDGRRLLINGSTAALETLAGDLEDLGNGLTVFALSGIDDSHCFVRDQELTWSSDGRVRELPIRVAPAALACSDAGVLIWQRNGELGWWDGDAVTTLSKAGEQVAQPDSLAAAKSVVSLGNYGFAGTTDGRLLRWGLNGISESAIVSRRAGPRGVLVHESGHVLRQAADEMWHLHETPTSALPLASAFVVGFPGWRWRSDGKAVLATEQSPGLLLPFNVPIPRDLAEHYRIVAWSEAHLLVENSLNSRMALLDMRGNAVATTFELSVPAGPYAMVQSGALVVHAQSVYLLDNDLRLVGPPVTLGERIGSLQPSLDGQHCLALSDRTVFRLRSNPGGVSADGNVRFPIEVKAVAWSPATCDQAAVLSGNVIHLVEFLEDGVSTTSVSLDAVALNIHWQGDTILVFLADGEVRSFELDAFGEPQPVTDGPSEPQSVASIESSPVTFDHQPMPYAPDAAATKDRLGRDRFTFELCNSIKELPRSGRPDGPAVLLGGEWGTGKSTTFRLAREALEAEDWVVVEYNAWRDGRSNPAWFGLLRSIRLAAASTSRREKVLSRPLAAFGFRVRELTFRTSVAMSPATAVVLLGLTMMASLAALTSAPLLAAVIGLPALLVGLAATGNDVRGRFGWDSYSAGRLKANSDGPPLDQVDRLARWYRMQAGTGRISELAGAATIGAACLPFVWLATFEPSVPRATQWLSDSWALALAAILVPTVVGTVVKRRYAGLTAAATVVLFALLLLPWRSAPVGFSPSAHHVVIALGSATLTFVLRRDEPGPVGDTAKRVLPMLLVVEDLDRCSQTVVCDVLDTLSTVFRSPDRNVGCLVTLVLADDNWIQHAYLTAHPGKDPNVGWQFIAKHFDLVLRTPIPASEHLEALLTDNMPRQAQPASASFSLATEPTPAESTTQPENGQSAQHTSDAQPYVSPSEATSSVVELEQYLRHVLAANLGLVRGNARAVRRAVNHYRFYFRVFSDAATDQLAKAALLVAADPSLLSKREDLASLLALELNATLFDSLGCTAARGNQDRGPVQQDHLTDTDEAGTDASK
jgi:hypothetical protein